MGRTTVGAAGCSRLLVGWMALTLMLGTLPASGIRIVAADECGGTHTVTHHSANFGPALEETDVQVEVFAPLPQENGRYLEETNGPDKIQREEPLPQHSVTKSLFDGCSGLSVEEDIKRVKSRIVIVERGTCDFIDKAINMQEQGAVGVIVVNTGKQDVQQMSAPRNSPKVGVEIPEVMISATEWSRIAYCRDNLSIILTSAGQAQYDLDFANKSAFSGTMMRGMALWILFQCGVNMFRYKRRHSELSARADAISRLPVCRYTRRGPQASTEETPLGQMGSGDPTDRDDEPICTICLEGFDEGECTRILPCQHIFHQACLDPWLAQSSSCPVCKRDIPDLPPPSSHLHQYGALAAV